MKLNTLKIRLILIGLNNKYFGGQLKLNFKVKITRSSKLVAVTAYKPGSLEVGYVGVSSYFAWNEEALTEALLHELVHVYECQVSKTTPDHGAVFLEQADRLLKESGKQVKGSMGLSPAKRALIG